MPRGCVLHSRAMLWRLIARCSGVAERKGRKPVCVSVGTGRVLGHFVLLERRNALALAPFCC